MVQVNYLPQEVIEQIAAGQVVERPASVVKELLENALDARADLIKIELLAAGKKKIVVVDNGLGMSKDDLMLSFQHHTTSKISGLDDLLSITSFGFRGEALSSIAASASLRIESKPETNLAGNYVELSKGKLTKQGSVGMPSGTRIVVKGLFSYLPARKKFLKSDVTEFSHVLQTVTQLALAHHKVAFTLVHNGKVVLELPKNQTLLERAQQLLSSHVSDNLLPITVKADHFLLTGFLGKPQIGTTSKKRQFLFVNNRAVYSKEIARLLKNVYATLLEPRSYPTFLLKLKLDHSLVDVNVDPQKTRVKFSNLTEILEVLAQEAKLVLKRANLTYSKRASNGFYDQYLMDKTMARLLKDQSDGWNIKDVELLKNTEVLQVHNLYLVAQTKRGLLIVDQHAAHERILYQEFLERFRDKRQETETLTNIIRLKLPLAEAEFMLTQLKLFSELGFKIEQSGSQEFLLSEVPKVFRNRDLPTLIQELLHDLIHSDLPKELDVSSHRTIAYLACRTAIKAGEKLTQTEAKRLIEKLMKTKSRYTCPHGRPVEVELDLRYLDKLFKRVK